MTISKVIFPLIQQDFLNCKLNKINRDEHGIKIGLSDQIPRRVTKLEFREVSLNLEDKENKQDYSWMTKKITHISI